MKFQDLNKEQIEQLAEKVGKSPEYLTQIKKGYKRKSGEPYQPSGKLAKKIEEAAKELGFKLNRKELRPDYWG